MLPGASALALGVYLPFSMSLLALLIQVEFLESDTMTQSPALCPVLRMVLSQRCSYVRALTSLKYPCCPFHRDHSVSGMSFMGHLQSAGKRGQVSDC